MRNTSIALVAVLLAGCLSACSSTSTGNDGGDDAAGGTTGAAGVGAGGAGGTAPFGLSMGDNCFDILAVATGTNDGCDIGVDAQVGTSIKFNYDPTTGTVKVGTDGGLGVGVVTNNMGTLTRNSTAMDGTCTWNQMDTTTVTITDTNTLTAAFDENETMFATACTGIPTGGMCTSTWTWMLKKSTTKTFPNCN